jgi:hypothetical protein
MGEALWAMAIVGAIGFIGWWAATVWKYSNDFVLTEDLRVQPEPWSPYEEYVPLKVEDVFEVDEVKRLYAEWEAQAEKASGITIPPPAERLGQAVTIKDVVERAFDADSSAAQEAANQADPAQTLEYLNRTLHAYAKREWVVEPALDRLEAAWLADFYEGGVNLQIAVTHFLDDVRPIRSPNVSSI